MNKLFLLLLIPILAFGQATTGYHRVNQLLARGTSGVTAQIVPNGSIYVTNTVTGATATIYSDPGLSSQITSGLVTSDKNGNYDYYIPLNYCVNETVSAPGQGSYTTENICINGGGGGSGTVGSGTAGQVPYYAANGTTVQPTSSLPNGITATTQTTGDNTAKVATDAFVLANVPVVNFASPPVLGSTTPNVVNGTNGNFSGTVAAGTTTPTTIGSTGVIFPDGTSQATAAPFSKFTANTYLGWAFSDNAASTTVTATSVPSIDGTTLNGVLVSGNTSTVATTITGPLGTVPAFHFTTSGQYVDITVPLMETGSLQNLWTKYAGNPVINGPGSENIYGQVTRNPAGGWYYYLSNGQSGASNINRFESSNLVNWSNPTIALASLGMGTTVTAAAGSSTTTINVVSGGASCTSGMLVYDQTNHGYIQAGNYVVSSTGTTIVVTTTPTTEPSSGDVIACGPWDATLQTSSVFQRVSDGVWIMLYRGSNSAVNATNQLGEATATDGITFTRINSGAAPGLFNPASTNFDPTAVIYSPSSATYYLYTNGKLQHGNQYVYTTQDQTFSGAMTAAANSPIFTDTDSYCASVWMEGNLYYMMVPFDAAPGSALYDHGLKLWRSTTPYFTAASRTFLGYAAVNDQTYDMAYLDTPTVPMMDVTKSSHALETGSVITAIYTALSGAASQPALISTNTTALAALHQVMDLRTILGNEMAFSFWVQFDQLNANDPVWSVGTSPTDGNPARLLEIKVSGANMVLAYWLGNSYKLSTTALNTGTPYYIVVTTDAVNTYIYVNGVLSGTFTGVNNGAYQFNHLYVGAGISGGSNYLHGYVWDLRVYPEMFDASRVASIYAGGN
jgi:hypothetical protein